MAAVASVTIQGSVQGEPNGSRTVGPIVITNAAACDVVQQLVLQAGANTITLPTNIVPIGCIIQLPSANTSVVTLKGVTGDTGIAIGKTTTHVLCFDVAAPPASFVLTSVSTQTLLTTTISFF